MCLIRKIYDAIYEFPSFYLEIESNRLCHTFSALFVLFIILSGIFTYKKIIALRRNKREKRELKIKIDKLFLKVLADQNKNNI
jgi:hypothetical protein